MKNIKLINEFVHDTTQLGGSYFLITYTESGDEIHFIVMSMEHYEYVLTTYPTLSRAPMGIVNDFIEYVHNNKTEDMSIQSYCEENWLGKYTITKIFYIPELGM